MDGVTRWYLLFAVAVFVVGVVLYINWGRDE